MIKKLGGGIRLALAQFRELAAFAQFASELDDTTRKQLERGQRVTEVMKQKQYAPLSIGEMAVTLFAVDNGYMDAIAVKEIVAYEGRLLTFVRGKHVTLIADLNTAAELTPELEERLRAAIQEYNDSQQ